MHDGPLVRPVDPDSNVRTGLLTVSCTAEFLVRLYLQYFHFLRFNSKHSCLAAIITNSDKMNSNACNNTNPFLKTRALRKCKPLPMPKLQPKVIQDSNQGCRINTDPDPDLCQICPNMLWMQQLVGVCHFAKNHTN